MLIINGCVSFGTDLFNHSKGLFFNRALDKLSECQYNMSFHVQKWPDRMYQVKRRQIKKERKKGGEKMMGGNRKKRKRKKEEKKKKKKEKRRSHKTKGKKGRRKGGRR